MGRKVIAIWLILTMILGFIIIIDFTMDFTLNVEGTTLYVNMTGSDGAYTSIQDAINAASEGNTVYVYSGTYIENIAIDKTINLTGQSRDSTTIEGDWLSSAVIITADYVNVTQFTIIGNGMADWFEGVSFSNVENCNLSFNNIISLDNPCVYIYQSNNNLLLNNNISSKGNAIIVYSSMQNVFFNNAIVEGGIDIGGDNIEYWNTHSIDISNTVNGKSIHYLKNKNGGIVPLGAGQVILANCSNITVEGQNINDTSLGISLGFSSYNNIINNNVSSNYKPGIRLRYSSYNNISKNYIINNNVGVSLDHSDNNNISMNNVSYNEFYGIYLKLSNESMIFNNTVFNNQEEGIFLTESSNNQLKRNYLDGNNVGILVRSLSKDNILFNNRVINNGGGIALRDRAHDNILKGNRVTMNTGSGIYVNWAYYTIIEGNTVSMNSYGIYLYSTIQCNVSGNNISSNSNYGVFLNSQNCNILSNNFTNNGVFIDGTPLRYFNSHEITTDNLVNGEPLYYYKDKDNLVVDGIVAGQVILANCTNVEIGNLELTNTDVGIEIVYTKNSLISNNSLLYNKYGIFIMRSENNSITKNNIISNNKLGIYSAFSEGLVFYHNNIIDNTQQAFNMGDDNFWNYSYPSGGNYWSDYVGVDNYKGPHQNITGSDGIGDTSYSIVSDSFDNYPLMQPIENYSILKQGWNLISIPFIQENQDLSKVLEMIDGYYNAVQWYDVNDIRDHWKHNKISKSFGNDLFNINEKMGFWIYIIPPQGAILLQNGTHPTENQTIQLYEGWNMIGYPSLRNYNRTAGLNNLTFDTHVDAIWTYNATTQKWKELTESDYFEIGKGYYIHAKSECTWEVPL